MKLEPNKFYVTRGGALVKALMEDGIGCMIGALYEPADEDPAFWDAFVWRMDGRFGRKDGRTSLDIAEMIATTHVYPPIPIRNCDWSAHYDNDEPNDDGQMAGGTGATELEAVMALVEMYPREDREAA